MNKKGSKLMVNTLIVLVIAIAIGIIILLITYDFFGLFENNKDGILKEFVFTSSEEIINLPGARSAGVPVAVVDYYESFFRSMFDDEGLYNTSKYWSRLVFVEKMCPNPEKTNDWHTENLEYVEEEIIKCDYKDYERYVLEVISIPNEGLFAVLKDTLKKQEYYIAGYDMSRYNYLVKKEICVLPKEEDGLYIDSANTALKKAINQDSFGLNNLGLMTVDSIHFSLTSEEPTITYEGKTHEYSDHEDVKYFMGWQYDDEYICFLPTSDGRRNVNVEVIDNKISVEGKNFLDEDAINVLVDLNLKSKKVVKNE